MIKTKLIFILFFIISANSYAKNLCVSLFEQSFNKLHPADINSLVSDLRKLQIEKYSTDSQSAILAKKLFTQKYQDLLLIFTKDEIDRALSLSGTSNEKKNQLFDIESTPEFKKENRQRLIFALHELGFKSLDEYDSKGLFLAHEAAKRGRVDILQLLNDYGLNLDQKTHGTQKTPLILAAAAGQKQVIDFLLEKKVNIDSLDSTRRTALAWAIWSQNVNLALHLIKKGADTSLLDVEGYTALDIARMRDYKDLTNVLEKINEMNKSKITPTRVQMAIEDLYILKRQISHSQDKWVSEISDLVFDQKFKELRKFLPEHEIINKLEAYSAIHPNGQYRDVLRAVDIKALAKEKSISELPDPPRLAKFMLDHVNPNFQDKDGNTILMWAIEENNRSIFNEIMQRSPNIHLKNKYGKSALAIAAEKNSNFFEEP